MVNLEPRLVQTTRIKRQGTIHRHSFHLVKIQMLFTGILLNIPINMVHHKYLKGRGFEPRRLLRFFLFCVLKSQSYQQRVSDGQDDEQLVEVGLLAVAQHDEGQPVAQDAQDADHDEQDTLDPELGRLEHRVVDGEVFVARVLLLLVVEVDVEVDVDVGADV